MARSSGARPKKAVREEVAALKARLGELRSDEWQKAQCVMDHICALCEVTGPSYGQMVPRACRYCHRFGHTRQHCKSRKAMLEAKEEEEYEALCNQPAYRSPTEQECSPEHWAYLQLLKRIEERREEGIILGRGGCKLQGAIHDCHDVLLDCKCEGCEDWEQWMAPVWSVSQSQRRSSTACCSDAC